MDFTEWFTVRRNGKLTNEVVGVSGCSCCVAQACQAQRGGAYFNTYDFIRPITIWELRAYAQNAYEGGMAMVHRLQERGQSDAAALYQEYIDRAIGPYVRITEDELRSLGVHIMR